MKKIHLEVIFRIIGIGSASGLLYKDNTVLAVSDNGGFLYQYDIDNKMLSKSPLFENNVMENIPKKSKADFEAITEYNDTLYIFGSGSTANRNLMITVEANTKAVISTHDLTDFYAVLQSFGNIKPDDFNIEGVARNGDSWFFFQRGNNGTGHNAVFTVTGDIAKHDFSVIYNPFKLPKISGIETCFTDAVLVGDVLYFLATAENTDNAYDDGEVLGSIVGRIDVQKMKVGKTKRISESHKFEGIALLKQNSKEIQFLLCEDNDSDVLESDIYKLTITK